MIAPRVILIVRLSAMGDLVMASGFAHALRAQYPEARLVWLVQDGFSEVVQTIPSVDQVIIWPRREWQALLRGRQWRELWRAIGRFREVLRALGADWALDLQGLLKSGLMARWSRAHRRVSLGGREGSRWLMTEVIDRDDDRPAERAEMGAEYRLMAHALGCPDPEFARPQLRLNEASQARTLDWMRQHRPQASALTAQRLVALVPFTTRPQKHWPESSWAALMDRLSGVSGHQLILLGGPSDQAAAQRLLSVSPGLINAVGQLSIQDSFALLAQADAVVGVDTGLTHAAQALLRPTVVLFGSTIPYQRRLHPRVEILWSARACSPCGRRPSCGGRFDCQRDLTPSMVEQALTRVLA